MSIATSGPRHHFSPQHTPGNGERTFYSRATLEEELRASLARELALQNEKRDLSQRQIVLSQEFEHRLVNSLQMIVSLLSMQSRSATPEAAAQLLTAATRVSALGRVHRRLHQLDDQDNVEFKQYLALLCADLAELMSGAQPDFAIVCEATAANIPTRMAIPLGFVVNELVTNAAKYAQGLVKVQFKTTQQGTHILSVTDDGPGLPAGFEPTVNGDLGMKIIQALVRQIGGELEIGAGVRGRGARFTVIFATRPATPRAPAASPELQAWQNEAGPATNGNGHVRF